MRGEDQDVLAWLVAVEQAALEFGLYLAQMPGVVAGGGRRAGELVQEPVLVDERQRCHPDPLLSAAGRVVQDPAVAGRPGPGDELQPGHAARPGTGAERRHGEIQGLQQHRRVVVARHYHDRRDLGQVPSARRHRARSPGAGR